jgi:hypothetical protein
VESRAAVFQEGRVERAVHRIADRRPLAVALASMAAVCLADRKRTGPIVPLSLSARLGWFAPQRFRRLLERTATFADENTRWRLSLVQTDCLWPFILSLPKRDRDSQDRFLVQKNRYRFRGIGRDAFEVSTPDKTSECDECPKVVSFPNRMSIVVEVVGRDIANAIAGKCSAESKRVKYAK